MTVIIPPVRNLSQSLLSRSHLLARASLSSSPLLRVTCKYTAGNACPNTSQSFLLDSALPLRPRSYATTSSTRPIGRPKAHTGRTAAKRTTPGASSGTSKSRSKKAGRKAKAKKPKPKPKKRPVSKTAQKKAEAQKSRDLREKALLKPPKKLPETAWTVLFSENAVKGSPVSGDAAKSAAQKYRNLSPEELERYNHTANENKSQNSAEYKRWLSTFSPLQIKEANNARNQLRKQAKEKGKKGTYPHIQDERLVKQPRNAYSFFLSSRVASGDMRHMKISEIGGLVAREWKGLSPSEKRTYDDMAAKDKNRYLEEYKSVYGEDPPSSKPKK